MKLSKICLFIYFPNENKKLFKFVHSARVFLKMKIKHYFKLYVWILLLIYLFFHSHYYYYYLTL